MRLKTKRLLVIFLLNLLLLAQFWGILGSFLVYAAATSPWTQTDWSGETGTNIDTASDPGQITLTNTEELTNTDFESDLTSWDTPDYSTTLQNTQSSNLVAYYPLNETSGTAATAINSAVSEGRDILIDGDMEVANTSKWAANQNATLSKETGTPHGGSRVLRVAYTDASNPGAMQTTLLQTGKTYRATGYARGDGTFAPVVRI